MLYKDLPELSKEIMICAKIFAQPVDKETVSIYFDALKDYSIEDVVEAIRKVRNTTTYNRVPLIGEINQAIVGREDENIDYAFENCKAMVRKLGFHSSVIMKDKLSMQTVKEMGGLQEFEAGLTKNETFFNFKRVYKKNLRDFKINPDIKFTDHLVGYTERLGGLYNIVFWDRDFVKEVTVCPDEWKKVIEGNRASLMKDPGYRKLIEENSEKPKLPVGEHTTVRTMDEVLKMLEGGEIMSKVQLTPEEEEELQEDLAAIEESETTESEEGVNNEGDGE